MMVSLAAVVVVVALAAPVVEAVDRKPSDAASDAKLVTSYDCQRDALGNHWLSMVHQGSSYQRVRGFVRNFQYFGKTNRI